jgi:hypothetical protein
MTCNTTTGAWINIPGTITSKRKAVLPMMDSVTHYTKPLVYPVYPATGSTTGLQCDPADHTTKRRPATVIFYFKQQNAVGYQ